MARGQAAPAGAGARSPPPRPRPRPRRWPCLRRRRWDEAPALPACRHASKDLGRCPKHHTGCLLVCAPQLCPLQPRNRAIATVPFGAATIVLLDKFTCAPASLPVVRSAAGWRGPRRGRHGAAGAGAISSGGERCGGGAKAHVPAGGVTSEGRATQAAAVSVRLAVWVLGWVGESGEASKYKRS